MQRVEARRLGGRGPGRPERATPVQYAEMLDAARVGGYAITPIKLSSSTTPNAASSVADHMFVNYAGVVRADCDIGDNRAYDPHTWDRNAEQAMAARVVEACSSSAPQAGASPVTSLDRSRRDPSLMASSIEREKQAAAEAGAALVSEGMRVGLGTGSTIARLLPVLAGRAVNEVVYVATSPETEQAAREHGLDVRPFTSFGRLDLALDGADQIAPTGWLVKGGGGAHTREKVVAAAAERFVVIASSNKLVAALAPPIPLELLPFGLESTLRLLEPVGAAIGATNAGRRPTRRLPRPGGRA